MRRLLHPATAALLAFLAVPSSLLLPASTSYGQNPLRQAEELLAKSAGKESAVRARRQRDLARIRNEIHSEGVLSGDRGGTPAT